MYMKTKLINPQRNLFKTISVLTALFSVSIFLSACTTITDLVPKAPYWDITHKKLNLQKDMYLCPTTAYNFWGIPRETHYLAENLSWCESNRRAGAILIIKGSPITINKVIRETGIGGDKILVYGTAPKPLTGEALEFSYLWEMAPFDYLAPAPWENQNISQRKIPGFGKKDIITDSNFRVK